MILARSSGVALRNTSRCAVSAKQPVALANSADKASASFRRFMRRVLLWPISRAGHGIRSPDCKRGSPRWHGSVLAGVDPPRLGLADEREMARQIGRVELEIGFEADLIERPFRLHDDSGILQHGFGRQVVRPVKGALVIADGIVAAGRGPAETGREGVD